MDYKVKYLLSFIIFFFIDYACGSCRPLTDFNIATFVNPDDTQLEIEQVYKTFVSIELNHIFSFLVIFITLLINNTDICIFVCIITYCV